METVTITRKSKIGYGYTSACENDERGNLRVCETTKPDHTGTIGQIMDAIAADRTLRSFQGGTYYSEAWFVKVNGTWRKINTSESRTSAYLPASLLDEAHPDDCRKYFRDEITVELLPNA